jgi:SAM-dependent methyltransferase
MPAEIWKHPDVAAAFLEERSLLIPDRLRQFDVLLRVLRIAAHPLQRVLDLGAGDAVLLALVLEAFPDSRGVAVDFSPLMLEQARKRLAKFGDRASVAECDLQSPQWLSVVQGPYDAVVSGFAIHHLADDRKRTLYQEIHGLLADGGVFVNCEHVSSASPLGEEMFNAAMSEHLWQRKRERGESVSLEQVHHEYTTRPDRAANILASVEDQCLWLREIGFIHVDCFWKYFELALFGGIKRSNACQNV